MDEGPGLSTVLVPTESSRIEPERARSPKVAGAPHDVRAAVAEFVGDYPFGDPDATGKAILAVVDAENPPLRVFFGAPPLQIVRERYAERLATWDAWAHLSKSAQGDRTKAT
jgi:hypothetical protein